MAESTTSTVAAPLINRIVNSTWLTAFFYLIVALSLLGPGTSSLPLMDRDEPKFARATVEMMEGKQWLVPYFNQEYRFDKPPLTYWWMRVNYWIFGITEVGARFHSLMAAWLVAIVIRMLGRDLFGIRAGFLAGLCWLTMLQVIIHGRLAVADMPLMLGIVLTMWAVFRLLTPERPPRKWGPWFWVLVGGMTLGFLAKGPVAWGIPAMAFLLCRFVFYRGPMHGQRLQPIAATLISLGVIALWGVPALIVTKGGYWNVGIGEHVVERGVSAFNGRVNIPIVYYLATALLSLLPWSGWLSSALFRGIKQPDLAQGLLISWFCSGFAIFALYATQLPHYVMPGFPALALILFKTGKLPQLERPGDRKWFTSIIVLTGVVSVIPIILSLAIEWPEHLLAIQKLMFIAGVGLLLMSVAIPLILRWGKPRLAMIALLAVSFGFYSAGMSIREVHPTVQLADIWSTLPEGTKFRAVKFNEPSLVFYQQADPRWLLSNDLERSKEWFARETANRAGVYLLREWSGQHSFVRLIRGQEPVADRDLSDEVLPIVDTDKYSTCKIQGMNLSRSSWVELLVVTQKEP